MCVDWGVRNGSYGGTIGSNYLLLFLHELRQRVIVVGQVLSAGHLSVAVPLGSMVMDELSVDRSGSGAGNVSGGDVLLLLGEQVLDEGGTYRVADKNICFKY